MSVKYSLQHPKLYPSHAVLDLALCVSMSPVVTADSGLDALSHACEALWNNNANPVTDRIAVASIQQTREALPAVLAEPESVEVRGRMQTAALLAGLAMGTTQTALAHSISYPFTSRFNVPHGLACSFTLAEVARYNIETHRDRMAIVAEAFDCHVDSLPEVIDDLLESLGVGARLDHYNTATALDTLSDNLITRARAANNLRPADGAAARGIARRALSRFCRAAAQ